MIVYNDIQKAHLASHQRNPVFVIEILFTNGKNLAGVNDYYFSTHPITAIQEGVITPLPPASRWSTCLDAKKISSVGQSIDDISGIATISGLTFSLVDVEQWVSDVFYEADKAGFGINRQLCDLYLLEEGDSWDDRIKVERQQLVSASIKDGVWKIQAQDIQRAARKKVMVAHQAILFSAITATSTSLVIARFPDLSFPFVANYSHLLIDDEAIAITEPPILSGDGLSMTFNNVLRHAFGTNADTHDIETDVKELPFIKGNPIDLAIQLLTGYSSPADSGFFQDVDYDVYLHTYINAFGAIITNEAFFAVGELPPAIDPKDPITSYVFLETRTVQEWVDVPTVPLLPEHWHAGMSLDYHIDIEEWAGVQEQILSKNLAAGEASQSFEFIFTESISAKLFVEKYIMQPLGLRMYAQGTAKLGLFVKKNLVSEAVPDQASEGDYENRVLDLDTVISWGELEQLRAGTLMSSAVLSYDKFPRIGGKFKRNPTFFDSAAESKHGAGREFKVESLGLVSSDKLAVKTSFVQMARLIQRYANPPMFIKVNAMPMMAAFNIGDDLRVKLPVRDAIAGADLNRCFEILERKFNPEKMTVDFTLISQSEQAYVVPTFNYKSNYADSAFLDGLADVDVPAAQNLLLLNPSGGSFTLQSGDYYIPSGEFGVAYIMDGTWTIHGTVRIFCSGEINLSSTCAINGVGKGDQIQGAGIAGTAGTKGSFSTIHEEGHINFFRCTLAGPVESKATVSNGKIAAGGFNKNALAIDIATIRTDANGLVLKVGGVPKRLAGARGGKGADGIDSQGWGKLGYAKGWAVSNGHADSADRNINVFPRASLQAGAAGVGGAGLAIIARRQIIDGSVNLVGGAGSSVKTVTSPLLNISVVGCDDRQQYIFKTGSSGAGSKGAFVMISEADPLQGIHRQNANITAINSGTEVLI